jgi:hypothetical protein
MTASAIRHPAKKGSEKFESFIRLGRGISQGLPAVLSAGAPVFDGPTAFHATPPGIAVKMAAAVAAEYINVGPRDVGINIGTPDVTAAFNANATGQSPR